MALGFIKKIFSFGKNEVETLEDGKAVSPAETETPLHQNEPEDRAAPDHADVPEATTAPAEAGPTVKAQEPTDTAEPARKVHVQAAPAPPVPPDTAPIGESVEQFAARPQNETTRHHPDSVSEAEQGERSFGAAEAAAISEEALDAAVADLLNELPSDVPPAEQPDIGASSVPESTPAAETPPAFVVDPGRRAAPVPTEVATAPKLSWFQRLRQGLARSSSQLTGQITGIFLKRKLDEDTLQDLEDVLIQADLGVETAMRITDALASGRYGRDVDTAEVTAIMADEIDKVLGPVAKPLELDLSFKPHVILVVGVNGTGKTTTIGKLAAKLTRGGLKVTLAAGDTFRAAAIEQLKIWGERTGSTVVSSKLGADAAGLAYEAYERAKANGSDVLIIDTAGRLQNKTELMNELEKIVRVLGKHDPDAPHTVLQTLDATTGQNALSQVEIFRNVAGVNGLVMTKLDGTARGGILVAISAKHKLPVYFIGVGEGVDDLEPFEAHEFASAIAGVPVRA